MLTRGKPDRGFTLIELLVVVAIIALLIAILIPSLGAAKERSRKAACLANLHGIGTALHTYAYENVDLLPYWDTFDAFSTIPGSATGTAGSAAATKVVLADVFFPTYMKGPKTMFCPSDKDLAPSSITNVDFNGANSARISYDFFSIYFQPEWSPKLAKMGQAPLAWDLLGGNGAPDATKALWQNHGKTGGHVVYANGSASWQDQKDWEMENWPAPATKYYGTSPLE